MPDGSAVSREMAIEIWTQAVSIARRLAEYVSSEGIGLLVPVNINSNPGTIVPEYKREYYESGRDINYAVIAITGFTRDYLIAQYGVPSEDGRAESLKRYPLPDNAFPVLGCIGSFEERKGLNVLIETVRRLADGPLPQVHAMLVGDVRAGSCQSYRRRAGDCD